MAIRFEGGTDAVIGVPIALGVSLLDVPPPAGVPPVSDAPLLTGVPPPLTGVPAPSTGVLPLVGVPPIGAVALASEPDPPPHATTTSAAAMAPPSHPCRRKNMDRLLITLLVMLSVSERMRSDPLCTGRPPLRRNHVIAAP